MYFMTRVNYLMAVKFKPCSVTVVSWWSVVTTVYYGKYLPGTPSYHLPVMHIAHHTSYMPLRPFIISVIPMLSQSQGALPDTVHQISNRYHR